jgi:glucose-1-phosphate thymidylyltransferase
VKGLVLAGGSGTRLRPVSHSMPKQLVPIAGRPVLEYVLEGLREIGVTEIGVVVGDRADEIVEALGDGSRFGARITYLRQDRPRGLAHCVRLARAFLAGDDFAMYLGDTMLPDGIAGAAAAFAARRSAARLLVQPVADPRGFGVAELGAGGTVRALVEKPERPRSDLAIIGVYFFTAAVHRAVAAIAPSARGELEITDAIQWLLDHGEAVTATRYDGYWKDTGRVEDVLACNRRLLAGLEPAVAGEVDAASELVGPVLVEPGARVVASRIEGPALIGTGTVIERSTVGPHVAIGPRCSLRDTRLTNSIMLAGACVEGVPGLADSLIGRSVSISRSAGGEVGSRLVVGDDTRIELVA